MNSDNPTGAEDRATRAATHSDTNVPAPRTILREIEDRLGAIQELHNTGWARDNLLGLHEQISDPTLRAIAVALQLGRLLGEVSALARQEEASNPVEVDRGIRDEYGSLKARQA